MACRLYHRVVNLGYVANLDSTRNLPELVAPGERQGGIISMLMLPDATTEQEVRISTPILERGVAILAA
jgi:hypothetical protein